MKKHSLIAAIIAGALVNVAFAEKPEPAPSGTPGPGPGVGCRAQKGNVEEYSFYGTETNVVKKVSDLPVNLSERRVFLQFTQGEKGIEVKLFDGEPKNDSFIYTITTWTPKDGAGLLKKIEDVIFANQSKDEDCVGKAVQNFLASELQSGGALPNQPAPESPGAAFAPSVINAKSSFLRSTIILLC